MKSIFITAIYANLHGTDLGGRTSRSFWYRWSLLSILKTNPTKVVCFTSKEEVEDLEHWFFEEQGIKREQLEFKVYYLRKSKFFKKIKTIKNIEQVKKWDRCFEIQYNKFFWFNLIENIYDYDRVYWIDAGLSHGGLFPLPYRMDKKWESDFLISLFTPEILDQWNKDTANEILLLAKNNEDRYYWSAALPEKYYKGEYNRSKHIVGGLFGGTPENYKRLVKDFKRQLEVLLTTETELYMEELILSCMYFNEPEKYTTYNFDDWYAREEWANDDIDPKLFHHMFLNE